MSKDSTLAKVSHLVGLTIVTSSLNVASIKALGPGGLRVNYVNKPTEGDIKEVEEFIASKVETGINLFGKYYGKVTKETRNKEIEDYRKFLAGDKD